ncbi:response regulator [Methylotuvimicrobium sp. KM1]|uniref:response regulator n=1 Tax=Methylotuvimicrobium sp. KM1 TaxID=3377707 RepID=UPI0038501DD6
MTDLESPSERVLLLVDDEINILKALKRSLRRDGYQILTANSGAEGLELLGRQRVGVILSDQRMPHMTGAEFLSEVKVLYPDTMRIMLSGYTDLESVTNAINEGAIYKFLTKPWEDDLLRDNIRIAFEHYEMALDNRRLTAELQHANEELQQFNRELERQVKEKTREIIRNVNLLPVSQEILEHLPVAVVGIDEQGMIAVANRESNRLLRGSSLGGLVGLQASEVMPSEVMGWVGQCFGGALPDNNAARILTLGGVEMTVSVRPMVFSSGAGGSIVVLTQV